MKKFGSIFIVLPVIFAAFGAQAATLVEMKDNTGQLQRFYIGEQMARWDTDDAGGYMLIEMNGTRIYNVDPRSKMISEINTAEFSGSTKKSTGPGKLTSLGGGPKVAGYATEKYSLSADGTLCSEVYLSKEAFKVKGIRKMWDVMGDMAERATAMAERFASTPQDPCDQADETMMAKLVDLGMPMRSIDNNGVLESEIARINEGEETPPGFFDLPEDYKRMDMNAQMRAIEQMNSQLPSPEQMMNMTDEQRQQMIIDIMGK